MKYWVYLNGEVPGSYTPEELAAMPGFSEGSMVCPAEGGAAEKNWSRAGQFPEIVKALKGSLRTPSLPPRAAADAAAADAGRSIVPKDADDILNDSSARIFSHVTELMKEFEDRREERALTQSLQREIREIKNELLAARERIKHLENQAALIPGFEDREKKLQEFLASARHELKERAHELSEAGRQMTALRQELERRQRSEQSLSEDVKRESALNEELSQQLAKKELSLAKAFGVIRKLEEMLKTIVPAGAAAPRLEAKQEAPPEAPAPARREEPPPIRVRQVAAPEPNSPSFTTDSGLPEDPQTPPEGQMRSIPAPWQSALKKISSALRKPIPLDDMRGNTRQS